MAMQQENESLREELEELRYRLEKNKKNQQNIDLLKNQNLKDIKELAATREEVNQLKNELSKRDNQIEDYEARLAKAAENDRLYKRKMHVSESKPKVTPPVEVQAKPEMVYEYKPVKKQSVPPPEDTYQLKTRPGHIIDRNRRHTPAAVANPNIIENDDAKITMDLEDEEEDEFEREMPVGDKIPPQSMLQSDISEPMIPREGDIYPNIQKKPSDTSD